MEEKIRKTGIAIIGDAPWGTHFCQFYQTKEDLIDILVPYFKAGLENNEFCMWVTSEPLKVEEAKAALKKAVKNLDKYIKKGQIEILDCGQWYTKSGKFEADRVLQGWVKKEAQAVKRGFDGLRLTGNTFWLDKKDWKKFADYEARVNDVIGKYRMLAICTYPLDKSGAAEIMDVVSNHQFALIRRRGKWEIIESAEYKKAEEQIKTRLAYEKSLIEISNEALRNPNLDSFINFSLKKLGELTDASRTYIFKIHGNGKKTSNIHEWVAEGITPQIDNLQNLDCAMVPFWMKKLRKNEIINFSDVKDIPSPEREILEKQGIKSILVVPMYGGKGLYGFMGFDECKQHRKWETIDAELLRTASQIITQVIERKKAEEKVKILSDAVENAYDSIIVTDLNEKIEYMNKAAEKMYGYKKSELLGKKITILSTDPKTSREISSRVLKSGWSGEILARTKNGKQFPVLLSASPIKNDDGKTIAVMGASKDLAEIIKLKKEKEILTEKVVQFTKQIPLTEKEKLVFYGLVRWPGLSDEQLSKQLKVKRPTVTAIKNRLKRQEFYSSFVIPDFGALGHELLSFVWGKSSVAMPLEDKPKINPMNKIIKSPENVFGVATDKEFLGLLVLKNFTEFKRMSNGFSSVYKNHPSKEENVHIAHFPLETTQLIPLFDYSLVLKNLFNLNIGEGKEKEIKKASPTRLTEREQIVLYALTKWPGLNDSEVAKKINITRQTVSKTRHKLTSKGIMTLINKPNLKKLGCDLLINLYYKFNPTALNKGKEEKIKELDRIYPVVFRALGESECLSLSVFKNFIDYKTSYDKLTGWLKEKNISEEEHTAFIIPITQIKLEKMDFAPLVKKTFDLKSDF